MIGDVLSPTHLIFILVVALLVLGPKRLPEVGRSLGKGIRDFRGAMAGIEEQTADVFTVPPPPPAPPAPISPATVGLSQSEASAPLVASELQVTRQPPTAFVVPEQVEPRSPAAARRLQGGSPEPEPHEYAD